MNRRIWVALAVAVWATAMLVPPTHAAEPGNGGSIFDTMRPALKGVTSVILRVSREAGGNADKPSAVMTEAEVQTLVELRLRSAGIAFDAKPTGKDDLRPTLLIVVQLIKISPDVGVYAMSINVDLLDWVRLDRAPGRWTLAQTWFYANLAVAGEQRVREGLRSLVDGSMDTFANEYLTANPKNKPEVAPEGK